MRFNYLTETVREGTCNGRPVGSAPNCCYGPDSAQDLSRMERKNRTGDYRDKPSEEKNQGSR